MRLALVFAILVGVNVYVFLFSSGSIRKVSEAAEQARTSPTMTLPALAPPAASPLAEASPPAAAPAGRAVSGVVRDKESLGAILRREGLSPAESDEIIRSLSPVMDFKKEIRAGQKYTLSYDGAGRLRAFELRASTATLYVVERGADGKLTAHKAPVKTEIRVQEVSGTIVSTLFDAIRAPGHEGDLARALVDVFASRLDFYLDAQKGDRFKLVVEGIYLEGELHRYGRVLAAEYVGHAGTFRAFLWKGGYYDERGENVARALLKTPLKYERISSEFTPERMHPILHRIRGHWGVDLAAPHGTPVWASAGGTVLSADRHGGGGNVVILDHGTGLKTVYMHLARFADGLRAGDTVEQKQVIGFVGETGLATGPHLHFAVISDGKYVDPTRFEGQRQAPVPASAMVEFKDAILPLLTALDAMSSSASAAGLPAGRLL